MPDDNKPKNQPEDILAPMALTIAEAAKVSRSSRSKIYQALQHGELEGKKVGRRTIILRHALAKYLSALPAYAVQTVEEGPNG